MMKPLPPGTKPSVKYVMPKPLRGAKPKMKYVGPTTKKTPKGEQKTPRTPMGPRKRATPVPMPKGPTGGTARKIGPGPKMKTPKTSQMLKPKAQVPNSSKKIKEMPSPKISKKFNKGY